MNDWLADRCVTFARRHRHPEQKERTVWEVFEADERPALIAYRGPFDGFHGPPASVSKTLLVRFDYNKYSVHAKAAGRPVDIHAYATHAPFVRPASHRRTGQIRRNDVPFFIR